MGEFTRGRQGFKISITYMRRLDVDVSHGEKPQHDATLPLRLDLKPNIARDTYKEEKRHDSRVAE